MDLQENRSSVLDALNLRDLLDITVGMLRPKFCEQSVGFRGEFSTYTYDVKPYTNTKKIST